jgi:hypothetical protein
MKGRGFRGKREDLELITNKDLVTAAHMLMDGIDLDPASSKVANEYVQADKFFTPQHDGLNAEEWEGKVYVFPPSGAYFFDKNLDKWKMTRASSGSLTSSHALWFRKLHRLWLADVVTQGLYFTNCTDMIRYDQRIFDFPVCILKTAPILVANSSEGIGVKKTSTSMVVYLQSKRNSGEATQKFIDIYSPKGRILC